MSGYARRAWAQTRERQPNHSMQPTRKQPRAADAWAFGVMAVGTSINMSEGRTMPSTNIKQEAQRLVEHLPEHATWDDLMYQIYVRQAIEAGLADREAGRTLDVQEVRAKFGLSP